MEISCDQLRDRHRIKKGKNDGRRTTEENEAGGGGEAASVSSVAENVPRGTGGQAFSMSIKTVTNEGKRGGVTM